MKNLEQFKPTTEDIERATVKNFVMYCTDNKIISVSNRTGGATWMWDSLFRAGINSIDDIRKADFHKIASTRRQFGKALLDNCLKMQKFINEHEEG